MDKNIHFFDSDMKQLKIINTANNSNIVIYNDLYKPQLDYGAETYTALIKTTNNLAHLTNLGNYIGFYWRDKFKMLQILKSKQKENGHSVQTEIYAEFVGTELMSNYIDPFVFNGTCSQFFNMLLQSTNYKLGYVSSKLDDYNYYYEVTEITSVYTIVQQASTSFNNYEVEFETKIVNAIEGQFEFLINVYADGERGERTYKRFTNGVNIYNTSREESISEFCSGIIPIGKNNIGISEVEWSIANGDPMDKPYGQPYLFDIKAHELIGMGDRKVLRKYKSEATDTYTLIWEAYYKLLEVNKVKTAYEFPVYLTDSEIERLSIGDTNYMINDNFIPPIEVEGRITSMEISFTDRTKNKIIISNFKDTKSNINKDWNRDDWKEDIEDDLYKLSEYDIALLREYLARLGLREDEIDEMIKKLQEGGTRPIPTPPDDPDDPDDPKKYKPVYLTNLTNGLFMGDKVEVIKQSDRIIVDDGDPGEMSEYMKAIKYYNSLSYQDMRGRDYYLNSNNGNINNLISTDNKWKLSTIISVISSTSRVGVDPYMLYALIAYNSQGDPTFRWYLDWGNESNVERYGLLGTPARLFGTKYSIPLGNGNDGSFTPSYNTLDPAKGVDKTVSNVVCNQNIYNQIKLAAQRLKNQTVAGNYNILFGILAYFHGIEAIFQEVYNYLGTTDKAKALIELGKYRADWVTTQAYKERLCTVLSYYKIVNKQLPYAYDSNNKKIGLGVTAPAVNPPGDTPKPGDETSKYRVTVSSLNIRNGPGTTYEILSSLGLGDEVDVYSIENDWAKIKYGSSIAYVSAQYIEKVGDNTQPPNPDSTYRQKIEEMAYKVLALGQAGKAWYSQTYRTRNWNNKITIKGYAEHPNLKNHLGEYGWDCSSLAETCYAHAGITTGFTWLSCSGGTIQSKAKKLGCSVWTFNSDKNCSKAKIGDLVMFAGTNGRKGIIDVTGYSKSELLSVRTHHVAVYVGNNEIIHARDYTLGISKTKLTSDRSAFFISLNKLDS